MEGNQNPNPNNVIIKQNNNQNNNPNDFNSKDIIINNKFDPKILNNGNIYNINVNFNGNSNIPNNYDKPINAEGLEESANKKEENEQNYDLPDEEEIKNNKENINQNHENSLNKNTDKEDAPGPVTNN